MNSLSQLVLVLAMMFNTSHSTDNTQSDKTQQESVEKSVKNTATQSKRMEDNTQTITIKEKSGAEK